MFRKFTPLLAAAAIAAGLAPAATAASRKPLLTGGRAQTQLEIYVKRAYASRASGRLIDAECERITRTYQSCIYQLGTTTMEAVNCDTRDPSPPWCFKNYNDYPVQIRYTGTGTVRLINGRLLVRASYPR